MHASLEPPRPPWLARLASLPALPIAHLPTPLEPMPRLRAALGGPAAGVPNLWVKRDDLLGLAAGGNKVRKLAYLLADAQARGAHKVVSFGGLQSNFLRELAAGCARLGIQAHCLYFERRPASLTGNLLLCQQLGARLHFLPLGVGSSPRSLARTCSQVRLLAGALPGIGWRAALFIPVGGHTPLGCAGYAPAALEILAAAAQAGFQPDAVVTAAGAGGTMAGLLAGFRLASAPTPVIGVDVGKLWRSFAADIADMATRVTALLDSPRAFAADEVDVTPGYGAGYARPWPAAQAAVELAARSEGLLLDPVYTGKALAGLIDLIGQSRFAPHQHVVFLHSGGWPALFANLSPSARQPVSTGAAL